MKRKLIALSRRYQAALQKHLAQSASLRGPVQPASLKAAQGLGRQAVSIGLDTLDIARIHDQALGALQAPGGRKFEASSRGAVAFFAGAIHPIEETHLAARQAKVQMDHLNQRLDRRTVELAMSNRRLRLRVGKRKSAELALRQSGENQTRLLKESFELQHRLQRLTRRLLMAQERERMKISKELRDEIAQTLLGINVRLLSLKADATTNTKGFAKEIGSTQQLVAESAQTIRRAARGLEQGSSRRGPARSGL